MAPRSAELDKHGLAFLVYRHGAYVFARSLDEAFENYYRVESGARTALYMSIVHNGLSSEIENPFYPRLRGEEPVLDDD